MKNSKPVKCEYLQLLLVECVSVWTVSETEQDILLQTSIIRGKSLAEKLIIEWKQSVGAALVNNTDCSE